jgi:hypothetical protein
LESPASASANPVEDTIRTHKVAGTKNLRTGDLNALIFWEGDEAITHLAIRESLFWSEN